MTKEKVTTVRSDNGEHEAVVVARVSRFYYSATLHIDGHRKAHKQGRLRLRSLIAFWADDPGPKKATYVYFRAGGFHADIGFYPFKSHTWLRYYGKGFLSPTIAKDPEHDEDEPLAKVG